MDIKRWVDEGVAMLRLADVDSARLDCLLLLEDELQKDRSWVLAHPEHQLSPMQIRRLKILLKRRATHEPLAYIHGKREFYGREFVVNTDVLVPRPETETMIDLLLEIYPDFIAHFNSLNASRPATRHHHKVAKIADVGTGSGVLGITAKLELEKYSKVSVDLLDIDKDALKMAKTNADLLTTGINAHLTDLLESSAQDYDILLCNLPYIPDKHSVNEDVKHEPDVALYSGPDGLDHYNKLFKQIHAIQSKPLYLLIESLTSQQPEIEHIAKQTGYKLAKKRDLISVFKHST